MVKEYPMTYKSTFKQDYPPKFKDRISVAGMAKSIVAMHQDDENYEQCSITHSDFTKKDVIKKVVPYQALTKTNFKMDRDDRIETFNTTHSSCYKKHVRYQKLKTPADSKKSHIPQGDPEKEGLPDSEHTSNFCTQRSPKPFRITENRGNPIQGDERSHNGNNIFNTTNMRNFLLRGYSPKADISNDIKYPKTEIPVGNIVLPYITTQNTSFPETKGKLLLSETPLFDRLEAIKQLQKSSLKNAHKKWDCFQTTNNYHSPSKNFLAEKCVRKEQPRFNDAVGFWIVGSTKMISSTRSHYKAPPTDYRNIIVDGSGFHTASDVRFGDTKNTQHTTTTMHSSFTPKDLNFNKTNFDRFTSSIPMNYYNDLKPVTSHTLDFRRGQTNKRTALNTQGLNNLKNSHIIDPMEGYRQFITTYAHMFPKKQLPRHIIYANKVPPARFVPAVCLS